jgi:hypothetical protein
MITPLYTQTIQDTHELLPMPLTITTAELLKSHHGSMAYLRKVGAYQEAMDSSPNILQIPDALVGMEVEVENIKMSGAPAGWQHSTDLSLRNDGAEYISVPVKTDALKSMLISLWLTLQHGQKNEPDFSWRTSIHTHVNVRNLTEEQVKKLFLIYLVFEISLFRFVGEHRAGVNFCVPIYQTNFEELINKWFAGKKPVAAVSTNWHKYAALNLIPVCGSAKSPDFAKTPKGTVEFRHMGGTKDYQQVIMWQNLILSIYKCAISPLTFEELKAIVQSIRSQGAFLSFKNEVFGAFSGVVPSPSMRFPYPCISFVRKCLSTPIPKEKVITTLDNECGLGDMVKKRYVPPKEPPPEPRVEVNDSGLLWNGKSFILKSTPLKPLVKKPSVTITDDQEF